MEMTKRIIFGFSGAIVVVFLLLAGSSLGAYVRAQVEEREAGAIACHDSVSCSRSDWVMQVTNTGTGKAISAVTKGGGVNNAAISGGSRSHARGVYGVSKLGYGVYGKQSTTGDYGYLGGIGCGVYGQHSTSGNYAYLGSDGCAVYAYSSSGKGVYGQTSSGEGVYGFSVSSIGVLGNGSIYGVYGASTSGDGVYGSSTSGDGVEGYSSRGYGVHGRTSSGYAGYFEGKSYFSSDVTIDDQLYMHNMTSYPWPSGGYNVKIVNGMLFFETSSSRYKENIEPFGEDFSKILQAEPRSYTCTKTGRREIGFIAEEFDDLGLCELVIYDRENRPDGVAYQMISLYLLEVLKDEAETSNEQQKAINQLEQKNRKLEERVEALERMMQRQQSALAKLVQK